MVASATGCLLGLWGEQPMFRADGKHYLGPADGKIAGDFTLWKLDSNQQYLLERVSVGPDPSFRMFISADTPVPVLARTYEHFASDEGAAWFGHYIEYVCDWLRDLKFALIPLEGELGWCVFAVSPDSQSMLQNVEREFRRNGIPTAHLRPDGDRFVWASD